MSSRGQFMFLAAVMLISSVVLLPIQVAAAGVLDQQQTQIERNVALWYDMTTIPTHTQFLGQTFRAGLTGSLTEVDLAIACYKPVEVVAPCSSLGSVTVEIHSGSPAGALLGSSSLPASAFPTIPSGNPSTWIAFLFSSPAVVKGNVYALVITTTNGPSTPPEYLVGHSSLNPYAGGEQYFNDGSGWSLQGTPIPGAWDLAFKTYVTPPTIPVGGEMVPLNMLQVLLPWLAVITVFGVVSVGTLLVKRRSRSN